jgi:hypothetical protein
MYNTLCFTILWIFPAVLSGQTSVSIILEFRPSSTFGSTVDSYKCFNVSHRA